MPMHELYKFAAFDLQKIDADRVVVDFFVVLLEKKVHQLVPDALSNYLYYEPIRDPKRYLRQFV